jgi:hypothetical protein
MFMPQTLASPHYSPALTLAKQYESKQQHFLTGSTQHCICLSKLAHSIGY